MRQRKTRQSTRIERYASLSLLASCVILLVSLPTFAQTRLLEVDWQPAALLAGGPCIFRVTSNARLESLTGRWQGRLVFFSLDHESQSWFGFAGVALESASGEMILSLDALPVDGARISLQKRVTVGRSTYPSTTLSVPRRYTEFDAATLARIREDQTLKHEVFERISKGRLWKGNFVAPLSSVTTAPFGTQRTFNSKVQSVHQGLDYRAALETPVAAMNTGTVVLARNLFFEGNCLVIDHGEGLLTLYLHLSTIEVKEGDQVKKGQVVGRSGASGRVTAPHLHVAVRWQGIYLDPAALLRLSLPR